MKIRLFVTRIIALLALGILSACSIGAPSPSQTAWVKTATSSRQSIPPTPKALPSPTSTSTPVKPDDEQMLAKALFPATENVLCNWQVLGKNQQEIYAWAFCQMAAEPHGGTSAPVVIKIGSDGHFDRIIQSEDEASILELFPAAVKKRAANRDFDFNALQKRMDERLADPTQSPLIITTGALDVPPNPPLPTHTPVPTRPVPPTFTIPTVPENPTVRIKLLQHWGEGTVEGAVWSPDGKQIAVIRSTGISFHNALTLQETNFYASDNPVSAIIYSPDGKKLAAGSDKNVVIWDLSIGQIVHTLPCEGRVWDLAYSPDGSRLLGSIENQSEGILLWDIESGNLLRSLPPMPDTIRRPFFTPVGQALAWQHDGTNQAVWDVMQAKIIRRLSTTWTMESVYNKDGSLFATAGDNGLVQVWQPEGDTFRLKKEYKVAEKARKLAFNSNSDLLAFDDELGDIQLWDWQSENMPVPIKIADPSNNGDSQIGDLSFSPDGKSILTIVAGQIQIWNVQSSKSTASFEDSSHESAGWFLNNDRLVLKTSDRHEASLVDGRNSKVIQTVATSFEDPNPILAISPDLRWVATSDGYTTFDVTATGTKQPGIHIQPIPGWLGGEAFSPDGQKVLVFFVLNDTAASANPQSILQLWDLGTGKMKYSFPTAMLRTAVFDPDGQWFALGGYDQNVTIHSAENGELLQTLQGHTDVVTTLSVVINKTRSLLASASQDGTICLWDSQTWKLLRILGPKVYHPNGNTVNATITALAFRPDGNLLVSASLGWLRFWNPINGELLAEQRAHPADITSLSFRQDGTELITGSYDGTLRLWEVQFDGSK